MKHSMHPGSAPCTLKVLSRWRVGLPFLILIALSLTPSARGHDDQERPLEDELAIALFEDADERLLNNQLEAHPKGHVIVIFKSSHLLYLGLDGKVVQDQKVKKSQLDKRLFDFLKGKPEDEVVIDFPVPAALSPHAGKRMKRYDKKTPEGEFSVCRKNDRASTGFTVALEINYPNLETAREALEDGRIGKRAFKRIASRLKKGRCPPYDTNLGGYIKIHGPDDGTMRKWRKKPVEVCQEDEPESCRPLPLNEFLARDNPYSGMFADENWTWGCVALELTTICSPT